MSKAAELANLIGNINAGSGGANKNVIINGSMNVAQRGTSFTGLGGSTGAVYTLDRFHTFDGSTAGRATVTQDSSAPSGFANSLKLACTTADTSIAAGEIFLLSQRIEGQNLQAFAKGTSDAKPFSLSFYAKANASKTYVAELFDIDNSRHVGKTFTVGTDWARHEITFPADTTGAFDDDNGRSLDVSIWLHGGSTYTGGTLGTVWQAEDADDRAAGIGSFFSSTDNTFFITGVQLEVGQNPTEFEHEPFERTLDKCQRYYQEIFMFHDAGSQYIRETIPFKVEMRASPTGTVFAQTNSGGGTNTSGKIYQGSGENTASVAQENKTSARLDVTAGGFTANQDVYGRVTLASEL
jgi:hypothetical protein